MKKIIASIIISCMLFASLSTAYASESVQISTKEYIIDTSTKCIYGISYETTAEILKENITVSKNNATVTVTDIDGNVKEGVIEDGDRLKVEADGEEYEYYLKTGIDGVSYSDSFNYRSYEEYKKIQEAINKTGRSNIYAKEDNVFGEIVANGEERVLKIAPKPISIGMNQYNRFNFIQIEEITGKAVVEYDVWQKDSSKDALWVYVNAVYSGVAQKPETGYALWGSRMADRGTLMRDDAGKARWISFEGKQLLMEDGRVYHVRQVLDFNGDIETYINGVQAAVTNENLSQTVSKSMGNISGITSIGYGIYLDTNGDWRNNAEGYGAMWDNVRVYDPVKYAEFYIDRLPDMDEAAGMSAYENTKKAREVLDSLTNNAINESEVSNLDKLLYWEEQFSSVKVNSEKYDVDNDNLTIKGVLIGETVSEFLENINKVPGYSYEFIGKEDGDEVTTGDVLKVTSFIDETAEFKLSVETGIRVKEYPVENLAILHIPYKTPVSEFLKNILKAESTTAKVLSNGTENKNVVMDGDTLEITYKNGSMDVFSLSVDPGSSSSALTGVGDIDVHDGVISGVEKGTTVEELKASLKASDRGTFKIYRKDGTEMVTGKITGTEMVKVFPEDAQPGAEFDIYTISCNLTTIIGDIVIATVEDEGFTYTGTIYQSGSAVEPGYNGIVTNYISAGEGTFNCSLPSSGKYNVYIYTSYHSSNQPYPAVIKHKGGSADVTVPQNQSSGWKLLGTYEFESGENVSITCKNTESGSMARLSAVKFEDCGRTAEITNMEAIYSDNSVSLKEGINSVKKENVSFKLTTEAELSKEDVEIISENGNLVEFSLNEENGEYLIVPGFSLKESVTYSVVIDSSELSKAYTYVLQGEKREICSVAEVTFYNEDGVYVENVADAASCGVNVRLKNTTPRNTAVKLVICYYPANGKVSSIVTEDIEIDSNGELKINKQMEINTPSAQGKVKVFLWQESFAPLGSVYYK